MSKTPKEEIILLGMAWVDKMPWNLANQPLANMSFEKGAEMGVKLLVERAREMAIEEKKNRLMPITDSPDSWLYVSIEQLESLVKEVVGNE